MAKIIAELCQNHRGDRCLLREMIWAAKEAGADYAKIQSMLADDMPLRPRFEHGQWEGGKQTVIKRPYQAEYDRLKPMDLSDEDHIFFIEECRKAGIEPMTTVFSRSRIPFVASLPWETIKVASFDCASYPMIRDLAERFSHLIISTGSTYKEEIRKTAELLQGRRFTFLHCVSIYPTPLEKLKLSRLEWLRQFTPSVGFSDHTLVARDGIKASLVALALGAQYIERHFTLLPPGETKDGPVSVGPKELEALVQAAHKPPEQLLKEVEEVIPEWRTFLGNPEEEISSEEELNRDYYRGRFANRTPWGWIYNWEEGISLEELTGSATLPVSRSRTKARRRASWETSN